MQYSDIEIYIFSMGDDFDGGNNSPLSVSICQLVQWVEIDYIDSLPVYS